jgi:hypothetical protein
VEGSRLVVEKLGRIHRENRNGGGVDQARCIGVHDVFMKLGVSTTQVRPVEAK